MSQPVVGLSATQISQVVQATTEREATRMNLLEKIVDWFNSGVQREALATLYNKLTDVKGSTKYSQTSDFQTEMRRMNDFAELRELALPEHRDKFKFDVFESHSGRLECAIRINGHEIYKNNDIGGQRLSEERFELMLGCYGMALDDACRNNDNVSLVEVLRVMGGEVRRMAALVGEETAFDDDIVVEDIVDEEDIVDGDAGTMDASSRTAAASGAAVQSMSQALPEAMKWVIQPLSAESQNMLLMNLKEISEKSLSTLFDDGKDMLVALTTNLDKAVNPLAAESAEKKPEARLTFTDDAIKA